MGQTVTPMARDVLMTSRRRGGPPKQQAPSNTLRESRSIWASRFRSGAGRGYEPRSSRLRTGPIGRLAWSNQQTTRGRTRSESRRIDPETSRVPASSQGTESPGPGALQLGGPVPRRRRVSGHRFRGWGQHWGMFWLGSRVVHSRCPVHVTRHRPAVRLPRVDVRPAPIPLPPAGPAGPARRALAADRSGPFAAAPSPRRANAGPRRPNGAFASGSGSMRTRAIPAAFRGIIEDERKAPLRNDRAAPGGVP
jgi:hypothetical protein